MSEATKCDWCDSPSTGGVFGMGIGRVSCCDDHEKQANYEVLRRLQMKTARPDLKCPYEVIR
jgi:hypothetical protein